MSYITTYVNPDADGICATLAYTFYKKGTLEINPVYFGKLDNETKFILSHFNFSPPQNIDSLNPSEKIILVDTHNVHELSKNINVENIVEILDHHLTGGTPEKFRNLVHFQNEEVGAVCTLIAEKFRTENIELDCNLAGIMLLAIISNTLNFNASSTSQRDRDIYKWLSKYSEITDDLIGKMFDARSEIKGKTTFYLLNVNLKVFVINNVRIGIIQIEMILPEKVLERRNFKKTLEKLKQEMQLHYIYFTGINIDINKPFTTIIFCPDNESLNLLNQVMEFNYLQKTFTIEGILLRKTHFIPKFKRYFYA